MQHRSERRSGGGERGQMIILTALVLATIFVALALVLNSGIYAENLSSRETRDTDDVLSFSLATDETVAEAYERTNRNGSATTDAARGTFNRTVDRWERSQQRRGAEQGVAVEIERTPHLGWRLNQSADRSFTSSSGADDWLVVDGASDVGAFRMNVTRATLYDADANWSDVNSSFHVAVSGTGDVELYVFQNSSHIVVHEGKPGDATSSSALDPATTCAVATSRAVVDFREEKLGTSDCPILDFSDDVSGNVDVSYVNATNGGEQVNGTYLIVVNGSDSVVTSSGDPTNFDAPGGADPTATAVVYSASWNSHYGSTDVTQERFGHYLVRGETYAG